MDGTRGCHVVVSAVDGYVLGLKLHHDTNPDAGGCS